MKKSLIIRIPQPCSEPWLDMEATKNGRHCANCQKEVIDFTTYSNAQLAGFMNRASGEVCGRFSPRQLNTNLLPAAAASYSVLSLPALALLALTLTATPAFGQEPMQTSVQTSSDSLENDMPAPGTVFGKILDLTTGEPVAGAHVLLKNNNHILQTAFSDDDGKFSFDVLPGQQVDTLLVSMKDLYEDTLIAVNAAASQELIIHCKPAAKSCAIIGAVRISTPISEQIEAEMKKRSILLKKE